MDMFIVGTWRAIALRGIAAVLFGLLTLVWPGLTLRVLVLLFGAFALVDGFFVIAAVLAQAPGTRGRRGILLAQGALSVIVGIVTFAWPGITALALLYLIAAWAFIIGVMEIVAAVNLRSVIRNEWLLGLAGAASIVFAALLVITPGAGALVITWLIGWYALFLGVLEMALAWRLRQLERLAERTASGMRPAAI
jgi:uncharacterized membrane protein HdeD (DUF308 family)